MPKYQVWATIQGSRYIGEFDAEDEDQAIEFAEQHEKADVNVCAFCSEIIEDPQVITHQVEEVQSG